MPTAGVAQSRAIIVGISLKFPSGQSEQGRRPVRSRRKKLHHNGTDTRCDIELEALPCPLPLHIHLTYLRPKQESVGGILDNVHELSKTLQKICEPFGYVNAARKKSQASSVYSLVAPLFLCGDC